MAFNGSGTFALYNPGNPVVTGTTISSTWANNTLSDIATGLSTCVTKDGQTTATQRVPFAAGISTNSITEQTAAAGVTIDGVVLKDTGVNIAAAGANSGQIVFPATANPSSNANTLDDYEEGTWTPTVAGSSTPGTQTYTLQIGLYTKIGRQVFVECRVLMSAKDGTTAGNILIAGLPFASATTGQETGGVGLGFSSNINLSAGYTQVGLTKISASTTFQVVESGDNVPAQAVVAAALAADSDFSFSATYSI